MNLSMYNPPHPGKILRELYLEPLELTITETAKGLGITRKTLSSLLNERAGISVEMALKLAYAFNTTPESWLTLQEQYDLWQVKKNFYTTKLKVFVKEQTFA